MDNNERTIIHKVARCSVVGCEPRNRGKKYYLPPINVPVAREWIIRSGTPKYSPPSTKSEVRACKSFYVCDKHFVEDCFIPPHLTRRNRLKKLALPSLYLPKTYTNHFLDKVIYEKYFKEETINYKIDLSAKFKKKYYERGTSKNLVNDLALSGTDNNNELQSKNIKCSVAGCCPQNRKRAFSLPRKSGLLVCQEWIKRAKNEQCNVDGDVNSFFDVFFICDKHFASECYMPASLYDNKNLKGNALPSLFMPWKAPLSSLMESKKMDKEYIEVIPKDNTNKVNNSPKDNGIEMQDTSTIIKNLNAVDVNINQNTSDKFNFSALHSKVNIRNQGNLIENPTVEKEIKIPNDRFKTNEESIGIILTEENQTKLIEDFVQVQNDVYYYSQKLIESDKLLNDYKNKLKGLQYKNPLIYTFLQTVQDTKD